MNSLTILDSRGDTTITWDDSDTKSREEARRTIADLKSKGYMFFLVDGRPADEISAGAGKLIVRRLTANEIVLQDEPAGEPAIVADLPEKPKRRGRPRMNVIATRPISGG